MEIEVNGTILQIDVRPLSDEMDSFLEKLFTKFFNEPSKPYADFSRECYADLETNIHLYFDGKVKNPPGQDNLFTNLTVIWKFYQNCGRVGEAQQFWQDILNIVLKWEEINNARIHKGSLFYFWSMTAILQGQLDKGFFLIHSAYEEDVLTNGNPLPNTPAFKTVSLAYEDKGNLLFYLVTVWTNYLEVLIANYQAITRREFSLDIFRAKFLNQPPNRETLFSFTYTLARFYDFNLLPVSILRGNFTSISEMNLLFDLVLVIDSVIYSSIACPAKGDWRFIKLADFILVKSGISNDSIINETHFKQINSLKEKDFSGTIRGLLDQKLVYSDMIKPVKLECDLGIAYCLRNYSAHHIGSFPVIRERHKDILQSLFNVLFLAVETK